MKGENILGLIGAFTGGVGVGLWLAKELDSDCPPKPPRRKVHLELEFTIDYQTIKANLMAIQSFVGKKQKYKLKWVDDKGNTVGVQSGATSFESNNPSIVVVEEDPENQDQFTLRFKDIGVAQITIKTDVDPRDGSEKPYESFFAVEVLARFASAVEPEAVGTEEEDADVPPVEPPVEPPVNP